MRGPHDGLFTGQIDAVDTVNCSYRVTFDRPGLYPEPVKCSSCMKFYVSHFYGVYFLWCSYKIHVRVNNTDNDDNNNNNDIDN